MTTKAPRLLTTKRIRDAKMAALCAAAIEYDELMTVACETTEAIRQRLEVSERLRTAARAYALAEREAESRSAQ